MSYCKKDGFKKNPVNQVKHNKIVFLFLKKVLRLFLNVVCFPPLKGNLKLLSLKRVIYKLVNNLDEKTRM